MIGATLRTNESVLKHFCNMSKPLNQIKSYASKKNLPLIPVDANDVSFLSEPGQFYNTLLDCISKSRHKIALSALYLGTGAKEMDLVQAIHDNIDQNKSLHVNIVLDAYRASRQDSTGNSSISQLSELLKFQNVKLDLVKAKARGTFTGQILQKVSKLNEVSSIYHSKILLFDDNVLITGANLSTIYFEKRQDRYMLFKSSKLFSDYLYRILDQLDQGVESMKDKMQSLNRKFIEEIETSGETHGIDSYIIPLVQNESAHITEKEDFLEFISTIVPDTAHIHMSTGYFNPSSIVNKLPINSVVAPSECANGFYGGSGLLQYVPRIYSSLAKQYIDGHPQCKLFLYDKPGWSFHGKGIWIEGLDDLYIHVMGSSNFNCRSSMRDHETQFVLLTRNKNLIDKIQQERANLWKETNQVESGDIGGLNLVYHNIARLLKTFL